MRFLRPIVFSIVAALAFTGCGTDGDKAAPPRILDAHEVAQLEGLAEIALDDTLGYNSDIEALVRNGFRPLRIENETTEERDSYYSLRSGSVLFVRCAKDVTLQACAEGIPTSTDPFVYVGVRWYNESSPSANRPRPWIDGVERYVAQVTPTERLSCTDVGPFQLNVYTMKQIPMVFAAFVQNGKGVSGDLEIDFGGEHTVGKDYYPAQGKVRWHCDVTTTPATTLSPTATVK